MDDSKTIVRNVRFAPGEWKRVQAQAERMGIPAGRLMHMATMRLLGDRTDLDHAQGIATSLEAVKPLGGRG